MLTQIQLNEIKEHLDKAQNPVFFFDNDPDGLCSFLLLQRYLGRGKGVPIKSFPKLTKDYFRKVQELNADYIFILDKPEVSEEFFKEVEQINLPVVWIDHHAFDRKNVPEFVHYYNPYFNEPKSYEPVTYLCYQITQKKEDMWLAVTGCISDKFVPDFYSTFEKDYAELTIDSEDAFEILYKSQIGKIAKIFSFALMDRTTNVINMVRFLTKAKGPHDVLEENTKNYTMHKRFNEIDQKYGALLDKSSNVVDSGKVLFFQYGGDLSISAILSNELSYRYPKKIVVVVYITGNKANVSIRGKNIREITLKSIEGLEGASGGGHEDAVGAQVKVEDLEKFRKNFNELVN